MNSDAERIPVEDNYLRALGRAAYNFVYLEWGIVCLGESFEPGFLREARNRTAGSIARKFRNTIEKQAGDSPDLHALEQLASSFQTIVEDRNQLMHSNPITVDGGEQRLHYDESHELKDWTVDALVVFADQTAKVSIEANRLLYK